MWGEGKSDCVPLTYGWYFDRTSRLEPTGAVSKQLDGSGPLHAQDSPSRRGGRLHDAADQRPIGALIPFRNWIPQCFWGRGKSTFSFCKSGPPGGLGVGATPLFLDAACDVSYRGACRVSRRTVQALLLLSPGPSAVPTSAHPAGLRDVSYRSQEG